MLQKIHIVIFICFFLISNLFSQETFSLLSWNIRDFGKTKDDLELQQIANIINDFDIVAIQEVVAIDPGGAKAVARLANVLNQMGSSWDYRISDPTQSPNRKTERYAFLWKSAKFKLLGRPFLDKEVENIVYREPYLARFEFNSKEILLVNYHSRKYNDNPQKEAYIFENYPDRFCEERIIIAGDFNLECNHSVFNNLKILDFRTSNENTKTTLKRKCNASGDYLNHAIDFIFYDSKVFKVMKSGVIDFVKHCDRVESVRKISDHLPVYLKVKIKH